MIAYQQRCQARVDDCLNTLFVPPRPQLERLYQAMRYSVMNGGKRVRPLLVYAACEALEGDAAQADGAACAVELIHAYSLVHDDLPAMDDDDLRRGQPTTHKAFDEACAILAGDGLQSLAFEALAAPMHNPADAALRLEMFSSLARAAGPAGMVGGQAIDLGSVALKLDREALELMHRQKTGALIEASVRLGALASGRAEETSLAALQQYAEAIGLAFQVQDDVLHVESDTDLGMVGGQAIDLGSVALKLDREALELMHRHKTGALIEASVRLGALASGRAEETSLAALQQYAEAIGLAFQVQDDILDVESDTATLGKHQGADIARDKPTYPSLLGMDAAKAYALELRDLALHAL